MEKGDTRQLIATITPNNSYSSLWTHPESLSCSACLNPWTTATSSTSYQLTVTPPEGLCPQTAYANILVGCGVWLPSVFTPNNDAINDIFYIYATRCIKEIKEFMIYNRWGQLIFKDSNFQGADTQHGWNGMIEGKLALPDTYIYKVVAETKTGELTSYLGAITLAY
jgi:gliding motility-associated-like protein